MIWKVMSVLVVLMLILAGILFVSDNLSRTPVKLNSNISKSIGSSNLIKYGAVPVFAENMRFNHDLISYSISDCDRLREKDMVAAFNIFSEEVKIVSFYEAGDDADIKVSCSNDFIEIGEDLFAAGEGGPSRIVNTSGFKVIEEGKILLYRESDCDYPVVALHELCHVFGFDHSSDPDNIMYNTSSCNQRMSSDMIELIQKLYSVEALSDFRIDSVSGVIVGRYLNFNISVLNEGLVGVDNVDLGVFADGKEVDVISLGDIGIGYGRTLKVENLLIGGGVDEVEFVVDPDNTIRELNENNNEVLLSAE